MQPTLGQWRRLQQAAGPRGTFTVLAIDHRGPLRRRMASLPGIKDVDASVVALKRDIVAALGALSTAVLLDPELGLEPCLRQRDLPGQVGLLVALDTGSTGDPAVLETGLVPDWSPERIASCGAAGVKLLVYFHPDAPEAVRVEDTVREVAAACRRAEIPLFLEPLSYDPGQPGRALASPERRRVVVETARRLVPLGVDVLKAEFPVNSIEEPDEGLWRAACEELTAACPVPWVILSGGVSEQVFLRQTLIACQAGASGVIAGRSIWNEAVTADRAARSTFLAGTASERLRDLRSMCEQEAHPFWKAPAYAATGTR